MIDECEHKLMITDGKTSGKIEVNLKSCSSNLNTPFRGKKRKSPIVWIHHLMFQILEKKKR